MSTFVGILAILILLLLLIFVRRPKVKEKARPTPGPAALRTPAGKADTTYHAVSLKFLPSACDAAKAMEGERYLSAEAPNIPLPDCDATSCKCRYVHYKDRRGRDDRRNPWGPGFGGSSTGSYEQEQRKRGERRSESADDIF